MNRIWLYIIGLFLLVGCTTDSYEAGDGKYSYLRADFGEVTSDSEKRLVAFSTDDDRSFSFAQPIEKEWVTTADSTYRVLVYYNANNTEKLEPISLGPVNVLYPKPLKKGEAMKTDPVDWTSLWVSTNHKYINLGMNLMVGAVDNEKLRQIIGIVVDDTKLSTAGHKHYHLTFYHNQNGIPEYYSQETFASIPTASFEKGDSITLKVNTYEGIKTKEMVIE